MHKHFTFLPQALIELLDQVEDVISVESSLCKDDESHLDAERRPKADPVVDHLPTNLEENRSTTDSNLNYLVLEVWTNTFFLSIPPAWETRVNLCLHICHRFQKSMDLLNH